MILSDHVFLSYRSLEADFALQLAADLKSAGLRLWMDRLESGIKGAMIGYKQLKTRSTGVRL